MHYSHKTLFLLFLSCIVLIFNDNSSGFVTANDNIGLNYGLLGDNLPPPSNVIDLYKSINITKIRIFDPNTGVLDALRGHQDIKVTVGVKDQDLAALAASEEAVKGWFADNIERYLADVNITFITVGNEVIPGPIGPQVLPVMQSLTNLVKSRNLSISISTVVSMANLATSYPPSAATFTPQAHEQLTPVLKFLSQTNTSILVNIYPYFPYASDPVNIHLDYAISKSESVVVQDGPLGYSNMFDAMFDAFLWAMEKEGVKDLPMVISETGWPSAGNGELTTPDIAATYNGNFVKHIVSGKGTPKRPNSGLDGFLFATFNENQKPAGTEQNFGLYNPSDMKPIYKLFFNSSGFVTTNDNIGLNYGLLGDNLPSPPEVINLYKSINITKIRIFDPNTGVLDALRGHQDIRVTVGVKDQDLAALAASEEAVKGWFADNIERYLADVNITFITVGNEVIPGPIGPQVLPVMQSLTNLVKSRNLPISISTVVSMANLATSYPPSAATFTPQAREQLTPVLKFLSQTNTSILVNIYPYFPYASDPVNIHLDYAISKNESVVVQDGPLGYSNMFDAMFDAFLWAMEKEGVKDLPMVISETGWPSAGNGELTTPDIAATYNGNFVKHIVSGKGTPKRPNSGLDGFLFATFNENQKPAGTEQNFGLYNPSDMKPIYKLF